MVSKDILDLVLEESETMVIEWTDKDGPGQGIIDKKIKEYFKENLSITKEDTERLIYSVRYLIKDDMTIMEW